MNSQKEVGPHWKFDTVLAVWQLEDDVLYKPADIAKLTYDRKKQSAQYARLKNALTKRSGYNNILTDNPENVDEQGNLTGPYKMWFGRTWKTLLRDKDLKRLYAHLEEQRRRTVSLVHVGFWERAWLMAFPWLNRPLMDRLNQRQDWPRPKPSGLVRLVYDGPSLPAQNRKKSNAVSSMKIISTHLNGPTTKPLPVRRVALKKVNESKQHQPIKRRKSMGFGHAVMVAVGLLLAVLLPLMFRDDHSSRSEAVHEDQYQAYQQSEDHFCRAETWTDGSKYDNFPRPVLDDQHQTPTFEASYGVVTLEGSNSVLFKPIEPLAPFM